jgi:hypothetical protein
LILLGHDIGLPLNIFWRDEVFDVKNTDNTAFDTVSQKYSLIGLRAFQE